MSLERVVVGTHPCNFYEVWIASFCYVTEASTPRKNSEEANYNVLMTIDTGYLKDHKMIAKLHWDTQSVGDDDAINTFSVLVSKADHL